MSAVRSCGVFVCSEWGLFLVDQFASALLKGLHSYGGFVNERVPGRID